METKSDGVVVAQGHVAEVHGSDQMSGFDYNCHILDACCMVMEEVGCTVSGGVNRIYASRGTGVVHPMSWESLGENANAVVESAIVELEGTGGNSTDNLVLVFLVHLASCNVYCFCS